MPIREPDKKLLWGRSGGRCAFTDCSVIFSESLIGEMAHIKGERSGAARYDVGMTDEDRNAVQNLILLCPNHHTEVDMRPDIHTAELLFGMKSKHESWVAENLRKEMANVTFAELEVITRFLIAGNSDSAQDLTVIPPREKIQKNLLSSEVEQLITLGMVQVGTVRAYINKNPDMDFGERLRKGFVEKYESLYAEGLRGDDLFDALFSFSCGDTSDFKRRAAGLSILTYFFESCEVFER